MKNETDERIFEAYFWPKMELEEGRLNLKVEGMTCNHCASTVEGIIQQEGGKDIHVDYLMGEASFDLSDQDHLRRITNRLTKAGYKADSDDVEGQTVQRFSDVERKFLLTLPFSITLFSHMFLPMSWWINDPLIQFLLCLPVFAIGLWHFGKSSYEAIRSGTINMDILILIGSTSAFAYSISGMLLFHGQERAHDFLFFETTSTIITLVLLGYAIEHRAVKQTTLQLQELLKSKPDKAKKLVQNGLNQDLLVVDASELKKGDMILVNAGDRVPADGTIKYGDVRVDEAMLTGEATTIHHTSGDRLMSGSIVQDGSGTVIVERSGRESTIGQIIELVKASRTDKPPIQKLADQISSWFVPTVLLLAVSAFFLNFFLIHVEPGEALLRSVAVLVIACPCAMGLATPTAVSVGLGLAAKLGIIVKRSSVFEELNRVRHMLFDKTGTITTGKPVISMSLHDHSILEEQILGIVKGLEMHSNHPIASELVRFAGDLSAEEIKDIKEEPGRGINGNWNDKSVQIGSESFVGTPLNGGDVGLLIEDQLVASFTLTDDIKDGSKELLSVLGQRSIQAHLVSGDRKEKVDLVANELGFQHAYSGQLPEQKLKIIQEVKRLGKCAMIGDGINDAPALASADVGISLGNENALAAESASIAILGSDIRLISKLLLISERTVQTIRQNLFWAFAYNIVAIPMAALGYLDPMLAALSMAFSDVIVIGNSLRLRMVLPKTVR